MEVLKIEEMVISAFIWLIVEFYLLAPRQTPIQLQPTYQNAPYDLVLQQGMSPVSANYLGCCSVFSDYDKLTATMTLAVHHPIRPLTEKNFDD